MKKRLHVYLSVVAAALLLCSLCAGCGGGGGGGNTEQGRDGSYTLTYTGSSGVVQFAVSAGQISGWGIDSSDETFPVSGTIDNNTGVLSISGAGNQGHTYSFTGNISSGGSWTSTAGDNGNWTAERTGAIGNVADYAGTWNGTFNGGDSGTWTATVDTRGIISGTIGSAIPAHGVVTGSGAVNIGAVGFDGFPLARFTGQFHTNGMASGTWASYIAPVTGTWSGIRQ